VTLDDRLVPGVPRSPLDPTIFGLHRLRGRFTDGRVEGFVVSCGSRAADGPARRAETRAGHLWIDSHRDKHKYLLQQARERAAEPTQVMRGVTVTPTREFRRERAGDALLPSTPVGVEEVVFAVIGLEGERERGGSGG
jgi:hypothetical protein